jgi:hypothetical protein
MPRTAQQTIHELFHNTVTSAGLVYDYELFDISVNQKLWSAGYHCKQLQELDIGKFQVLPSPPTDTQSYGSTIIIPAPMLDIGSYCNHLNLYLDGFFMNVMSALDTLAHELFILYESTAVPNRIYISTAKDMLRSNHPSSLVGTLLDTELSRPWFGEFEPFRHCTTHESLIRHDDIVYRFDPVARCYRLSRKIKLPDNPQVRPFTYNRNRLANEYVASTFKRINKLVGAIYKNALRDIRAGGNILPVPAP